MNKSARRHKEELQDLYFELHVPLLARQGGHDRYRTIRYLVRNPTDTRIVPVPGTRYQPTGTIQRPMIQTAYLVQVQAYKPTSLQTRYPISKLRRKYYHHPEVTTTKLTITIN